MKNILLLGEPLALLVAEEIGDLEDINTFYKTTAGAELNVAVGLTRLGFNTQNITTIRQDSYECGKICANLLFKRLENMDKTVEFIELPTKLIVRNSTKNEV